MTTMTDAVAAPGRPASPPRGPPATTPPWRRRPGRRGPADAAGGALPLARAVALGPRGPAALGVLGRRDGELAAGPRRR